jgi:peptidoglycan glycosyltransferase
MATRSTRASSAEFSSAPAGALGPRAHRLRPNQRMRPMIAVAGTAFLVGVIVGAGHGSSPAHRLATHFTTAWARGDYATMYADVDAATQRRISVTAFADAYRAADELATATGLTRAGRLHDASGEVVVPVRVRTRLFGTLRSSFRLPISGQGSEVRIAWTRTLLFPGLRPGEQVQRHTALPPRAALLGRDGSPLASGPAPASGGQRATPLGSAATAVVGTMGPIPDARRGQLTAEGVPPDAMVGAGGLELALDDRLRGQPGGELLAGQRVLATAVARPSTAVRTTISPGIQRAAVAALGGQLGGVVALRPSNGEILAVAGLGIDDLQPPGSTFKMVTVTGVLESGLARTSSTFPIQTAAVLDGVQLQNANGEACGGTLVEAFAVSCNSVFAPLGAKLGATRLVQTAERFGFNQPVGIPGAVESTLPQASQINGPLAVGSTAIGQDQVLASALQMTIVAATIADGGRRPQPTFNFGERHPRVVVTAPTVAHTVRRLMVGVVRNGTGQSAALPNVTVAGKTGTAELTTTACAPGASSCQGASDPQNTDAWFAAFAPALRPRIAVGVMLVRDGAGGATAAPVARQVLEAALSR